MKKLAAIFIIILFTSPLLYPQSARQWVSIYAGPDSTQEMGEDIVTDAQGNVYVTGKSGNDMMLIKYNSSGVQQWLVMFGNPNYSDYGSGVAVDSQGNVYVVGAYSNTLANVDIFVNKYSPSGTQLWSQKYSGPGNNQDLGSDIRIDGADNIYVSGTVYATATQDDLVVIKYNTSGVRQWAATYNGGYGDEFIRALEIDNAGNSYVTGDSRNPSTGTDIVTVKFDSAGVTQFVKRYNEGTIESSTDIKVDASGNIYTLGYSGASSSNSACVTIKYNSTGTEMWAKTYRNTAFQYDRGFKLALDSQGDIYIAGASYTLTTNSAVILKYNSSGVQQWAVNDLDLNENDRLFDIRAGNDGNLYVLGGIGSSIVTGKYNSSGVKQWLEKYPSTGNYPDAARGMHVDNTNNIYITGWKTVISPDYDCITIKYSSTVGIENISSEIPSKFELSQNYPNPFNPSTSIEFSLPKAGSISLSVYNSLGKEVAVLVDEKLNAGTYRYGWNAAGFTSGVYFYRLTTENFSETRKMVLLK